MFSVVFSLGSSVFDKPLRSVALNSLNFLGRGWLLLLNADFSTLTALHLFKLKPETWKIISMSMCRK